MTVGSGDTLRPFFSTERRLLFLFVQVPVICIIIELKAGVGEGSYRERTY